MNGPISAPTPRAAINSPNPMSPAWNTCLANTAIIASTPAAAPNPNLTETSAHTRRSRRV